MKYLVLTSLCFSFNLAIAQQQPVGIFDTHTDIGNPKHAGSARYDESTQVYTITGSGYNIWFNRDEFQYLFKKISGDFILTANFEFVGDKGNVGHRKIGWMLRESTDDAASSISACSHFDGLTVLQWRPLRGSYMRDPEDQIAFPKKSFEVIQLERTGRKLTMRVAHPGEPLQVLGSHEMTDMKDTVLAGLYICSHDSNQVAEARVWNVRIDKPVSYTYNPGKEGWLGCRLETMNVGDGKRKVVRESAGRFEAPNWMPDGKKLLYNENGSLYKIPIEGGTPEKLNTGSVDKNNNDHGISFDGKMLAISSQRQGLAGGGSTVYVLPLTGGEPKMVTEKTPSYWHGWAPNGKEVAYVAMRDAKVYNLYKMSINGGQEIPLTTNTTGHVDGPEYSPDGKYIYYNANPTGTMQIWRMKPDGSAKEQLTFDEYPNWFPHISPDGKWMVFISFPIDIDPDAHPSYKRVMLRLMPLTAIGAPRVIAYLYGGQGTINAPSWSPDSKQIAFVSNKY
jgi:TolB protein